MDRWSVHRSKALRKFVEAHGETIRVEWLPAYAPDLNPVEQVWNHSKYSDLANLAPEDLEELRPERTLREDLIKVMKTTFP